MAESVRLTSNDGQVFEVPREAAELSEVLRHMLASSFAEAQSREITFREISGAVLAVVVDFMQYKLRVLESAQPQAPFEVPAELALETLFAANFLEL